MIASPAHLSHNCDQTCDRNCEINYDANFGPDQLHHRIHFRIRSTFSVHICAQEHTSHYISVYVGMYTCGKNDMKWAYAIRAYGHVKMHGFSSQASTNFNEFYKGGCMNPVSKSFLPWSGYSCSMRCATQKLTKKDKQRSHLYV